MATFTDIVSKQREKGEGIGSSLATAFSERAKERLDPRNYLFKKKGLLTALLPGLKGYQAGGEKLKGEKSEGLGSAEEILNTIADRLGDLKTQFRMVAKNSIVLPQMARDTNLVKRNIVKLVKLMGETEEKNTDNFFKNSSKRESEYESAMKAGKPTPNKKGEEKENKSLFRKILEFIIGTVGFLFKSLISIIPDLVGGLKKLSSVIGTILSIASNFGLLKMAGRVLPSLGKGLLLAGAGAATAMGLRKALPAAIPHVQKEEKILSSHGTVGDKVKAGQLAAEKERELATKAEKSLAGKTVSKTATEGVKKGLWGRFLAYVERKSPQLFARIGKKLAVAAALMAIPIVGWVAAAIDIGFTLWTAYEIYQLWKEFTNEEESEIVANNKPLLDKNKYDNPPKPVEAIPPGAKAPPPAGNAPASAPAAGSVPNEQRQSKPYPAGIRMDSGNENRPSMVIPTAENAKATSSLASKMRKGDTFSHPHEPGTDILAQKIMSNVPEFAQFTGFNDKFHQQNHPRSKHAKGLAIDFVTKGGAKTQDAAVKKIEKMMTDAGLKPNEYLVQSEILGKTPHATGDHVHVEFKDEKVAEKFRANTTNSGMVASAYARNPNAPSTQLAAAPAPAPTAAAAPAAAASTAARSVPPSVAAPASVSPTPPSAAAVAPKSVKLNTVSQTNMDLSKQSISSSGSPIINNVVNNNSGGGGGGGTTVVAGANLYDKDLVDLFMDSLGTA